MFEPFVPQPTDQDLIEYLAEEAMGWDLHHTSGHRPGERDVPHAWRWHRDRVRIMVYIGGHGDAANVEFNPLDDAECAAEMVKRLKNRGINVLGWDLATPEGRRATCEAAREQLKALPPEPSEELPKTTPTNTASLTSHTLSEGEWPPTGLIDNGR